MNYRSPKNKNNNRLILIFIALLLGVTVLVLGFGKNILGNFLTPVFKTSFSLKESIEDSLVAFKDKKKLQEKIKELKQANLEQALKNLNLNILREEVSTLKSDLGRAEDEKDFILARVLSRPPISPFDILTIDLGSDQGLKRGDRVFVGENIEIGSVAEVFSGTSKVKLYSSPKERVPVEFNGKGTLNVAEGKGGGSYTIQAPRSLEVKKGDKISRPGLNSGIIGIVESSEINETDAFKTIQARLPVNIFEIIWVYVDLSEKELSS